MRRLELTGGLALGLCALAISGVAVQAGDRDIVNSRVTLEVKHNVRFKGKVRSPASDCSVGRKVLIFREQKGRDDKVGKAFADEAGKYVVKVPGQNGRRVYALVRRTKTPLDTICRPDRSRTVTA